MSDFQPSEDSALMERIKLRDQEALVELNTRYRGLVHSMAMQVLKNAASAEEVTQDIFFQVWRWPERWDAEKGRFTSWLLTVTRYTAIDRLRRENRQPPVSPHSLDHLAEVLGRKPSFDNARNDNGRVLRGLIKELPKEQREVVLMAYYKGMTHSEISEHSGLPLGTVKSRLRLGLEKLKEAWFEAMRDPFTEPE
jgi:RNA polymerase sigma-70 factor (ECF subfamily)